MSEAAGRRFCADEARETGASLEGTASLAATWVLLEHRAPWGRRAVEEDPLPDAVRSWLVEAGRAAAGPVRAVFVRRADRTEGPVCVFVARAFQDEQALWRVDLGGLEELQRLDPAGLERSEGPAGMTRAIRPRLLICGNARRDRCCARRGLPLYEAIHDAPGGVEAWLSTHLGGHRYAAVAVALPLGAQYGFLGVEDADPLLRATEDGDLFGPGFRGRTFHPPIVQAADGFLRRELGLWRGDGVRWLEEDRDPEEGAVVLEAEGRRYLVEVRSVRREALVSCGPEKTKEIVEYEAGSIREET